MSQIILGVLSYFVSRPSAVESLEDIARWRLSRAEISRTVEETRDALEWLVKSGIIERLEPRASAPLFRLKMEKLEEAESLLAEMAGEGDRER